jgi:hypothetical protein
MLIFFRCQFLSILTQTINCKVKIHTIFMSNQPDQARMRAVDKHNPCFHFNKITVLDNYWIHPLSTANQEHVIVNCYSCFNLPKNWQFFLSNEERCCPLIIQHCGKVNCLLHPQTIFPLQQCKGHVAPNHPNHYFNKLPHMLGPIPPINGHPTYLGPSHLWRAYHTHEGPSHLWKIFHTYKGPSHLRRAFHTHKGPSHPWIKSLNYHPGRTFYTHLGPYNPLELLVDCSVLSCQYARNECGVLVI